MIRELRSESGVMMEEERYDHIVSCSPAGSPLQSNADARGDAVLQSAGVWVGAIRDGACWGGEDAASRVKTVLAGCWWAWDMVVIATATGLVWFGWRAQAESVQAFVLWVLTTTPCVSWRARRPSRDPALSAGNYAGSRAKKGPGVQGSTIAAPPPCFCPATRRPLPNRSSSARSHLITPRLAICLHARHRCAQGSGRRPSSRSAALIVVRSYRVGSPWLAPIIALLSAPFCATASPEVCLL